MGIEALDPCNEGRLIGHRVRHLHIIPAVSLQV